MAQDVWPCVTDPFKVLFAASNVTIHSSQQESVFQLTYRTDVEGIKQDSKQDRG